jgi:CDP-diacylglycerol--glycerol-3-phosphate 3-phosphatidyltransferase
MIKKNEILTLSNALSFFRLLLAFPIWYLLDNFNVHGYRTIAFILCLAAAATDYLDGYFARKRNEVTEAGKIIDPLADKILVGIIAIKLYLIGELSTYYISIIVLRDVIIFVGGIVISMKLKKVLPSNLLGKITVTIIGIVFLLVITGMNKSNFIFQIFYVASILLIYVSLLGYVIRASEFLKMNSSHGNIQ